MKMAKKVLITGGSSKIGQKLIKYLDNYNLAVRILTRRKLTFSNDLEIVFGDLLEPSSLLEAVRGIDEIIHLAAVTHSDNREDYWRVNVTGTENLIKAAQQNGVNRVIFVSTRAIGSDSGAYGQSKLAAEEIVKESGINWVILRPSEVYGMRGDEMIEKLIEFIKRSYLIPVIKTSQNTLTPLYINDLITALGKVIEQDNLTDKIYLLAGPESFSFNGVIGQICQFYQLKRLKVYCPLLLLKLTVRTLSLAPIKSFLTYDQIARFLSPKSADISLAQKDLGFSPINFQKGLSLLK